MYGQTLAPQPNSVGVFTRFYQAWEQAYPSLCTQFAEHLAKLPASRRAALHQALSTWIEQLREIYHPRYSLAQAQDLCLQWLTAEQVFERLIQAWDLPAIAKLGLQELTTLRLALGKPHELKKIWIPLQDALEILSEEAKTLNRPTDRRSLLRRLGQYLAGEAPLTQPLDYAIQWQRQSQHLMQQWLGFTPKTQPLSLFTTSILGAAGYVAVAHPAEYFAVLLSKHLNGSPTKPLIWANPSCLQHTPPQGKQIGLFGEASANVSLFREVSAYRFALIAGRGSADLVWTHPSPWDTQAREIFFGNKMPALAKAHLSTWRYWAWALHLLADVGIITALIPRDCLIHQSFTTFRRHCEAVFSAIYLADVGEAVVMWAIRTPKSPQGVWYADWQQQPSSDFEQLNTANDWLPRAPDDFTRLMPFWNTKTQVGLWQSPTDQAEALSFTSARHTPLLCVIRPKRHACRIWLATPECATIWGEEAKTMAWEPNTIHPQALEACKAHYETQWRAAAEHTAHQLEVLLDFSELIELHLSPEYAPHLAAWAAWADSPNTPLLRAQLLQPEKETLRVWEQLEKAYREAARAYERLGHKACRDAESHERLERHLARCRAAVDVVGQSLTQAYTSGVSLLQEIAPQDLLHYALAVWTSSHYTQRYAQELLQEMPALPYYKHFWEWVHYGSLLAKCQLSVSQAIPYRLEWKPILPPPSKPALPRLRYQPDTMLLEWDNHHTPLSLPQDACRIVWGNRPALVWVLDWLRQQYINHTLPTDSLQQQWHDCQPALRTAFKRWLTVLSEASRLQQLLPNAEI